MANELFKALAKKQGKEKSMSILKQMTAGGKMPADLTDSMYTKGGGVSYVGEDMYKKGGSVKKKKKKMKKYGIGGSKQANTYSGK